MWFYSKISNEIDVMEIVEKNPSVRIIVFDVISLMNLSKIERIRIIIKAFYLNLE